MFRLDRWWTTVYLAMCCPVASSPPDLLIQLASVLCLMAAYCILIQVTGLNWFSVFFYIFANLLLDSPVPSSPPDLLIQSASVFWSHLQSFFVWRCIRNCILIDKWNVILQFSKRFSLCKSICILQISPQLKSIPHAHNIVLCCSDLQRYFVCKWKSSVICNL